MIATDLDGTLLRSDSTLSPRTRDALRCARESGLRVVAATARPYRVFDEIFGDAAPIDMAICGNGSGFYDLQTKKVTFTHLLDTDVLRHVVDTILAHIPGAGFAIETGHRVLYEPGYLYRPTHDNLRIPVQRFDDLLAEPSVKLMVWLPDRDPDAAWARLSPLLSDIITCTWSSERAPLEIAAPGVSKAAALDVLCGSWGVASTDVVAFGDAVNDLPMLSWAGVSYAVANASPEVRSAATHQTTSNDDDGVARVIEDLVQMNSGQRSARCR